MNTAQPVRYYGITDEITTCGHCGRENLKRTVILELLDADGNGEGIDYYGTTCAARALAARTGQRWTGTEIANKATSARTRMIAEVMAARDLLGFYADVMDDRDARTERFIGAARHAAWAQGLSWLDMAARCDEMIARNRETVAEGARFGIK